MITIKTEGNNDAITKIKKGTPLSTILLGIEMLIEALIEENHADIDYVLSEIKKIYIRDKE